MRCSRTARDKPGETPARKAGNAMTGAAGGKSRACWLVVVFAGLGPLAGCSELRVRVGTWVAGTQVAPPDASRDPDPATDGRQDSGNAPSQRDKASPDPDVVLATARERNITMFGELPETDSAYAPRANLSARQHSFTEEGADFDPHVDHTGKRLVFASTRHHFTPDLYIKSIDGVAVTQLTSDPASDVQPVFSPNGTRVAFASDRSGNWDIWVAGVDGGPPMQVTHAASDEIHPSWSSDGTQLVYCSLPERGGQWGLWIRDASARGTKRFIGYGLFPEWSPTGNVILFQRARERGSRLFSVWTITLVNGEPRYPTELASRPNMALIQPTWGRGGSRVAYTSVSPYGEAIGESGRPVAASDIWVMDADGGSQIRLTDGFSPNYGAAFAPDGRMFFSTRRAGEENVWSLTAVGGAAGGPAAGVTARRETTSDGRDRDTLGATITGP